MEIYYNCPSCGKEFLAPFSGCCSNCGFSIDHLTGKCLSDFGRGKALKHTEPPKGTPISLEDGQYNAFFNYNGEAKLEYLVKFAISYGDRDILPPASGRRHENPIIVSYIPEIIGSGTSIYNRNLLPCSGICVISPHSYEHGHPFPVIDNWVNEKYSCKITKCKFCGEEDTGFGQPFCVKCYNKYNINWENMVK